MMMYRMIVLLLILPLSSVYAADLEYIRKQYLKAADEKDVCREMITLLENEGSKGVAEAYLGAFKAIWAKHTINPATKLRTFNAGRDHLDKAVSEYPDEIEIRYLRYSIQLNSPGFLGYKDNMEADRALLLKNRGKVQSDVLRNMIDEVLKKQ